MGHNLRMTEAPVTLRELNRWTLARQMLLERHELEPVEGIRRLAGMQAQYSPAPYVGLWSRLRGFQREDLHEALDRDRVLKATLMRGTLHLVPADEFNVYRVVTRNGSHVYSQMVRELQERGIDTDALRDEIVAAVRESPRSRAEVRTLARDRLPDDLPEWAAFATVALSGELINLSEDARFGYFGGTRYRVAPVFDVGEEEALRHVVSRYLAAFGPATRRDLAQWSGQTVSAFAATLDSLDLVTLRGEDGKTYIDLPEAPRSDSLTEPPIRFLPKWDNLLLAYARRERVLPEAYRKTVIRKNGDVLPTILVDGQVAATWEAPLKGRAVLTVTPLEAIEQRWRREIEDEGEALLAWLRPEIDKRELRWILNSPA